MYPVCGLQAILEPTSFSFRTCDQGYPVGLSLFIISRTNQQHPLSACRRYIRYTFYFKRWTNQQQRATPQVYGTLKLYIYPLHMLFCNPFNYCQYPQFEYLFLCQLPLLGPPTSQIPENAVKHGDTKLQFTQRNLHIQGLFPRRVQVRLSVEEVFI